MADNDNKIAVLCLRCMKIKEGLGQIKWAFFVGYITACCRYPFFKVGTKEELQEYLDRRQKNKLVKTILKSMGLLK